MERESAIQQQIDAWRAMPGPEYWANVRKAFEEMAQQEKEKFDGGKKRP